MSHKNAKHTIQQNKSRLAKHFSGDLGFDLDRDTVLRLQKEIEQAETHLEEADEDAEDWHHGDNFG